MIVQLLDPLDPDPTPGAFYVAAMEVGTPVVLVAGPVSTHAEAIDLIDRAHTLTPRRPMHYTTARLLPNTLGSVLGLPRGRFNRHFGLEE